MSTTAHRPVPGTDDDAISSYGRLVEVVRDLDRAFAASLTRAMDLPMSQFEVLLRLGRTPGDELTMSDLAQQLGVTAGGATRLVDRVLTSGWVARRGCTSDRRVQHVRLTDEGRAVLQRALRIHRADLAERLTSRLTTDERAQLDALLDRLRPDGPACGGPGRREAPVHGGHTGA